MMEFRIADTFTDSLAKLTSQEQKAVKTTAFDLQMNPANPGMKFHKLDRAKDTNFWSIRVSGDIRLIIHKTSSSFLLCYVDHHDNAYKWAERRKLEIHPKTGAAQFVEIRERVQEVIVPVYVESEEPAREKPLLFKNVSDDILLGYGVPSEWLNDVHQANEDTILELASHLPGEAAEALLDLATGATPQLIQPVSDTINPFDHPDAQRRFRVMSNVEELERALEYPWEKWMIFLHPAQRHVVERDFNGPAKVSGSAGTGKTIVALHRAVFLARSNPDARLLLTTFSEALANALRTKLRYLINSEPRIGERLEVCSMNTIGHRLFETNFYRPKMATKAIIENLIVEKAKEIVGHKFTQHFLMSEWEQVVDAWQLETWEEYRDVARLGRKTRLPENRRAKMWSILGSVRSDLENQELITYPQLFKMLSSKYEESKHLPYDYIVVDEAQDVSIPQLRFLAALGRSNPNSLFFAGDLGQRIFQQPFSWKALGIDIRGRSRTLKVNYRTSHQIRIQADRLLGPEISDVDGNKENRRGTVSVFNGPKPEIYAYDTEIDEARAVAKWLSDRLNEGVMPHEIAIFVRSDAELGRAKSILDDSNIKGKILDDSIETTVGFMSVSTMHLAKGLEFRAVVVMACDDDILPLKSRIEAVSDETDLEEVYNTERHLLYVACTRARDNLLVTGVTPESEFLDDMDMN